jgi:hypothetical protein
VLFSDPISNRQVGEESGESLITPVQGEDFIPFLRFMESVTKIFDDLDRGVGATSQHVEIGFLVNTDDAHVSHWLCTSRMAGAVERDSITAEEVAGHEHLDRTFFAFTR